MAMHDDLIQKESMIEIGVIEIAISLLQKKQKKEI